MGLLPSNDDLGYVYNTITVIIKSPIIRPETLVRWHRAGFRCYWRWKSRPPGGRPPIDTELRALIRRMSISRRPQV
jgi:hypothetical protein